MKRLFFLVLLVSASYISKAQQECIIHVPSSTATGFLQEFSFNSGANEWIGVDGPTLSVNVHDQFWTPTNLYGNVWKASGYVNGYSYEVTFEIDNNDNVLWANICRE